jgi:hypothetical protein
MTTENGTLALVRHLAVDSEVTSRRQLSAEFP